MARPKRQNPLLDIARAYLDLHFPELKDAPLQLRQLDGPPGSPRFAVMIESCCATGECPHGTTPDQALHGQCPVRICALRDSIRLLLSRQGEVIQVIRGGVHWSASINDHPW